MSPKMGKKSVPNYGLEICAKIWARNRCRNTALKSVPKYGTQIGAEIRHRFRYRHLLGLASENGTEIGADILRVGVRK